ncbi:hypothetical protein [Alloyangia pacifica]|uniref:Uncharacterized protein n=1 Tax=Alloyangia pacifica TaxID=311180 RepID=A0A1I6PRD0_9RHOB|nr:hypothetical protein [Alloyangia pacifica]SDG33497.1 hypothetical protein SAMN04488245_102406 [Alloyangia pacifica]SFS42595.1 hypothetical protein SAMN04488050_101707 [Alloyangia pacifica]
MTYHEAKRALERLRTPYQFRLFDTPLGLQVEVWNGPFRVRSASPAAQYLAEQEQANR